MRRRTYSLKSQEWTFEIYDEEREQIFEQTINWATEDYFHFSVKLNGSTIVTGELDDEDCWDLAWDKTTDCDIDWVRSVAVQEARSFKNYLDRKFG